MTNQPSKEKPDGYYAPRGYTKTRSYRYRFVPHLREFET